MRGARRIFVVVTETVSGVAAAGLVGLAAGSVAEALSVPAPAAPVALGVVAAAIAADLAGLRWPAARPLAVRRQVPEAWGKLFGASVAAVLYGVRLGIGPATILVTWLWWAAFVLSATLGPWVGAGVLAAFHVSRVATQELAMARATDHPRRVVTIERWRRPVAIGVAAAVLGAGAWAVFDRSAPEEPSTADAGRPVSSPDTRTISPKDRPVATDAELHALLLETTLPGFDPDESLGAGSLDIEAAAALEPDVSAERALLETRGFRHGESRAFSNADGDVVWVQIYELRDEQQSRLYLEDGWEAMIGRGGKPFAVESIAGARGMTLVDETPGGSFVGHVVAFTTGARHVLVIAGSPRAALRAEDATAVAIRQAERLGAPTGGGVSAPATPQR